jgi:pyrimidine-nucleoside phosphorylase
MMKQAIDSGRALEKFGEIIEAQGGDRRVIDDPTRLPIAQSRGEYTAPRSGYVARVSPRVVGHGIIALGGGRRTMDDEIDPSVGFVITVKPGEHVKEGEQIATIHARDESGVAIGRKALSEAIFIADSPVDSLDLISHRVTAKGREKWKGPSAPVVHESDADSDPSILIPPPA